MHTLPETRTALAVGLLLLTSLTAPRAQSLAERIANAPHAVRASLPDDHRAIRRTVPLTDSIQRALRAGSRDFSGRPTQDYWQIRTDFRIDARLEPATATIHGSETITLHNHSPDALRSIALRLDHNIFRFGVERGASVPAEQTDGMVLTRIVVDGRAVDLHAAPPRRGSREERSDPVVHNLHRTVAFISLPEAIAAGATCQLEIDWHTRLPGGSAGRGHRMTQRWGETLFQPTQWFPRLCKYDDMHGWVTSPYLGPAEFYNNFGSFDVALDVPAGWLVSATGTLQNGDEVLSETTHRRLQRVLESDDEIMIVEASERGAGKATAAGEQGRLVWRFHADLVNDFAWATARDYVWRATRATIPQRGPIPIHMLYLPERANHFTRAGRVTRHALEFYSQLWIPYAFPQLTLQDGPSSGMEYPMVINSNQGAADHEAAHQWWPMMVGTNETMYGWMDEGLNTYMNILSGADLRGQRANLDGRGAIYGRQAGRDSEPPMMWTANYAGDAYGFVTYAKAPMMLSMLGGIVGDDAVQAAMREYARTWAFKHPSPWDFVFFMQNALDRDLGWFWYYWLWTTASCDGSIETVVQDGDDIVVTVRQAGDMPSPIVLDVTFKGAAAPQRIQHPTSVWFDGSRTFEVRVAGQLADLDAVRLDPHGRFPDADLSDNTWPRK